VRRNKIKSQLLRRGLWVRQHHGRQNKQELHPPACLGLPPAAAILGPSTARMRCAFVLCLRLHRVELYKCYRQEDKHGQPGPQLRHHHIEDDLSGEYLAHERSNKAGPGGRKADHNG